MASQNLKRISIRWLPEPAYEDTDTTALNVGGYFIDLRVLKTDGSIQWSRAGERRTLKESPLTYEWTHIIDSLGLTEPDVASFTKLPNGDDLEIGTYKNPNKGGALTEYEEIWRDVTNPLQSNDHAWILQSTDGLTFLGMLGNTYLGISLSQDGSFHARREERILEDWKVVFKSTETNTIPSAAKALSWCLEGIQKLEINGHVELDGMQYVIKALDKSMK